LLVKLEDVAATYREIQPSARLRRYVECYWWQSRETPGEYVVLPDGCADILFSQSGGEPKGLTMVGLMTTPLRAQAAAAQSYFGVRFRPGMASAFVPGAELLTDEIRSLDDLTGGASARRMFERLAESKSADEMAGAMDEALRPLNPPNAGERVLRQLASVDISLDDAISESGLSVRHFRRLCLERAGVSPKYLSRILRFRKAVQRIATMRARRSLAQPSWADFAVACGYYDQAHFIREFQEFAGCTPGRFLQSPAA
jgi:AraC-like DNA-binding protein